MITTEFLASLITSSIQKTEDNDVVEGNNPQTRIGAGRLATP